jgi:hypothetical protein
MNGREFRPTAAALAYLLSSEGSSLLGDLAGAGLSDATLLYHTSRLRRTYPPDIVSAALDLTLLRQRARVKFSRAGEMFFTRQALEQASAEVVSRHRAQRFAHTTVVADLCCGIGGDTLALAAHAEVLALDIDPVRLRMAEANACVYQVSTRVRTLEADVTGCSLPPGLPFWADPARRVQGQRVFSLASYQPPLSALLRLVEGHPAAGIKLSPGVDYAELASLLGDTPHEVEIISVRGEGREAVLWLGEFRTAKRRATLLPGGHTLTGDPRGEAIPITPPGRYLYEPDAAVIRAHLVEDLATQLGATKLSEQIAYLTADALVETPFATAYQVEEVMPFNLKRLKRRLKVLSIGELVIKKRGFPVDPEQFRHRLSYSGQGRTVLVLTRVRERPTAILCRPPCS